MEPSLILLYLALSLVAGVAGRKRRIGFWGFFFASIVFTPWITLLFLFFAAPGKHALAPRGRPVPARGSDA